MSRDNRLHELAGRYADGGAAADEVHELEAALRSDPSFRRWFVRYLSVDAALTATVAAVDCGQAPSPTRPSRRHLAGWWTAVAALLVVTAMIGLRGLLSRPKVAVPQVEGRGAQTAAAPPPPVLLVAATKARWADGDLELSLRSGDVPAGALRLESGSAEFQFAGGGTALLLGPAAVRFPGNNRVRLEEGKLLCQCPTAESRLTVTTPTTEVVDLGTEFAVDVPAGRPGTSVVVVTGEVRVGTARPQVLRAGQAAEVGADSVVRLTPLPPPALAELLAAAAHVAGPAAKENLLADPSFTAGPSGGPWRWVEGHVEFAAESAKVFARGHRFWPSVRQQVETGDVGGQLVVASIEGRTPAADALRERQAAILKVVFLDVEGREFASASRHFLHAGTPAFITDQYVTSQVAAFAPPGTWRVQFQLLLSARGQPSGMVEFRNPRLVVIQRPQTGPAAAGPATQP